MSSAYHFVDDLDGLIADIPEGSIVSRTFYKDDQINVTAFGFDAGQALSEHTSSQTAIIHVLSGEGTLTLGNDEKELRPGVWVRMPAGMKHSLSARTPLKMTLLLVKS